MQAPGSRMYIATHKILFLFFLSKMVISLMAIIGWLCNGVWQDQLELNSILYDPDMLLLLPGLQRLKRGEINGQSTLPGCLKGGTGRIQVAFTKRILHQF